VRTFHNGITDSPVSSEILTWKKKHDHGREKYGGTEEISINRRGETYWSWHWQEHGRMYNDSNNCGAEITRVNIITKIINIIMVKIEKESNDDNGDNDDDDDDDDDDADYNRPTLYF
jgi:hypothetical protein